MQKCPRVRIKNIKKNPPGDKWHRGAAEYKGRGIYTAVFDKEAQGCSGQVTQLVGVSFGCARVASSIPGGGTGGTQPLSAWIGGTASQCFSLPLTVNIENLMREKKRHQVFFLSFYPHLRTFFHFFVQIEWEGKSETST
uniref:Uncharacterized protein n=1 Tax=Molossus molossus TaxID=27622 RepID=A0A7J8C8J0_MOLMO|nr:hypothetical protein HJG59_009864 [Molossus molossus]